MRTKVSTLYLNIIFLMVCAATLLAFRMSKIYAVGIIGLAFSGILLIIIKRDFLSIEKDALFINNLLISLMSLFLFHGMIINGIFTGDGASFLTWSLVIVSNVLVFILAYNIINDADVFERFLVILFLYGIILTFLLLYLIFKNFSIATIIMSFSDNIAINSSGIGSKKNIYGSLLMFTVVPAYYLARERQKILFWIGFLLQVFAVIVVFARSVWIAVLVSFIMYYVLNKGKSKLVKYFFLYFFIFFFFLILMLTGSEELNLKLNNSKVLSILFSDRNTLWSAAIRAARANPFGYGIENDQKAMMPFISGVSYVIGKDPHDTFLRYLVSNGYLGLVFYILVTAVPFIVMNTKKRMQKIGIVLLSMYCGVVAYQVTEVVLLGGYSFKSYLYTLFFFLTCLYFVNAMKPFDDRN